MSTQKIFYFFFTVIFLTACNSGKPLSIAKIKIDFIDAHKTDLSETVFFIGPELDSTAVDIIADCDCCASNLAFVNDSSFIYIELCMGGNSYIKGSYILFGDLLILQTNKEILSEEYEVGSMEEDLPTNYEIIQQDPVYLGYRVSELKGKQVITYTKDDYAEYGMLDSGSVDWFLKEWSKEKAIKTYLRDF